MVIPLLSFQAHSTPIRCGLVLAWAVKYGVEYLGLFRIFWVSAIFEGHVWLMDRCSPPQLAHLGVMWWQKQTSVHFSISVHWHEAMRCGSAQRAHVGGSLRHFAGQDSEICPNCWQ